MGVVYEAHDPDLGRDVAVKVVLDPDRVEPLQLTRFLREARITAQLEHPGIVPVYERGEDSSNRPYFVMRKLTGHTLEEVLTASETGDGVWSLNRLLRVLVRLCEAVAYAHSRGVAHRDIKPSNVMLGEFGEVLLLDWGVARHLDDGVEDAAESGPGPRRWEQALTQAGSMIGTPGYMAPEQALGAPLDPRSDVWSLGAVLYRVLTGEPTYGGQTLEAIMQLMAGPPERPARRAPERGIPDGIAAVCERALAHDPADRYASALDLAAAVDDFLEGRRRKEEAERSAEEARVAWAAHLLQRRHRRELEARERELASVPPWTPLSEKTDLLSVRRRLVELEATAAETLETVVSRAEQALARDPDCAAARDLLAELHYLRFEDAERSGDGPARRWAEGRVRRYDHDGSWVARIRGVGSLTLLTDPPARVACQRLDRTGLVAEPGEPRDLGMTPLRDVPLEPGSYILTLRAPGTRETLYPVHLDRGQRWESGRVPLYSDSAIGPGFVYIAPGPARFGGDPEVNDARPSLVEDVPGFFAAVLPVTVGDYNRFLNSMPQDEAWAHVPRRVSSGEAGRYWTRPGAGEAYRIPEADDEGDRWDPRFPVFGVSWWDGNAYADWLGAQLGSRCALPTEAQFEKMARGVDGRPYAWGDGFDATLCRMRDSSPGRPQPTPVGAFPADRSVYGVRDVCGSMRTWCRDAAYDGDPGRRVVRGGFWNAAARQCRVTNRWGDEPQQCFTLTGIRLVREQPLQTPR